MTFLRRLRDAWLQHATAAHVTEHGGDCPHCRTRTTWTVRVLDGYVRCQTCGDSPLERNGSVPT